MRFRTRKRIFSICFVTIITLVSCFHSSKTSGTYHYTIDDQKLYDTIMRLDSVFFAMYNTCSIDAYMSMYADSIEFYHDKGGYINSKDEIRSSTLKYICGKVTRHLVPGSIEVYPIKNYGAVEIGLHRFYNNQEPDAPSNPGRFTIIWQQTNDGWKIKKVISLH